MTEAERIHRAQEAQRLLDEPLLNQALDALFDQQLRNMLKLGATEDEPRYRAAVAMQVIESFRSALQDAIMDGRQAAQRPRAVA